MTDRNGPSRDEAARAGAAASGAEAVISARGLTKRYRGVAAVDGLDLEIRRGQVHGLLGPNGAGKTTTLRMLLGLIRPTRGEVTVLGRAPGDPDGLRRLGALVEEPSLYPYMSGRDNLRVLAHYCGVGDGRVEEVLAVVELAARADDEVKTYSLGMRQRLGVAAALLKDPELLILDEPTNGLDPKGMLEMRRLIGGLGRGRRTVVLSSHLMVEVEQVCDRAAIIHRGRLVADGPIEELRSGGGLLIGADPIDAAERVAAGFGGGREVTARDGMLYVDVAPEDVPRLNAALVGAGIAVRELRPAQQSLESVFLELTDEQTV